MSDRMRTAKEHLNSRLKGRVSVEVIYRRGADYILLSVVVEKAKISPLTLLAGAVAERDMTQPSPEHADHPFSFSAEDLVIDGTLTKPKPGDVIEMTLDGNVNTYRLSPAIDGERDWKYVDGYEDGPAARIRINTRLMNVEIA